jgi:DNA modification methylase
MKVPITMIKVAEDRHRKVLNQQKLEALAESIKEHGLIEPIVIEKVEGDLFGYRLIAGERRLRAHQLLGETHIEVVFRKDLDEWHRNALELEENIQREQLTWQEEIDAKLKVHELYQSRFGTALPRVKDSGWTLQDTAELMGESKGSIVQDIQLAKAIRVRPELGKKDSKVAAFKQLQIESTLSLKRELAEVFAQYATSQGEAEVEIRQGDSTILLKEYEDESFDFCITDPPYSIGMHDIQGTFPNRGDVREGITFDDSKDTLLIQPEIFKELYRILKSQSHCYVFFAIAKYYEIKKMLEESGFWVCPTPLFWIKNNALNLRPWLIYPVNYEPIFYCAKGYPPRPLSSIQTLSTFDHPIMSGILKNHPAEKPLPLLKWLIGNCSEINERGIDPFAGGGSFLSACKEMGRRAVGIELDNIFWLEAKKRLEGGGDNES